MADHAAKGRHREAQVPAPYFRWMAHERRASVVQEPYKGAAMAAMAAMAADGLTHSACFTCPMELPVLIDGAQLYRFRSVIAVFRGMHCDAIEEWLMPDGQPRNDRDLAADVLVKIRSLRYEDDRLHDHDLMVPAVLRMERAAALIVATFLSALPRHEDGMIGRAPPEEAARKAVETTWARANGTYTG